MKKTMKHRSAHKHLFHISKSFLQAFTSPAILYLIVIGNVAMVSCAYLLTILEQGKNSQLHTFYDALWWAFCTVTTVGYGDIVPVTFYGRLVGVFLMLTGACSFFGFTAILIASFSDLTTEKAEETERLTKAEYDDVVKRLIALTEKIEILHSKIESQR